MEAIDLPIDCLNHSHKIQISLLDLFERKGETFPALYFNILPSDLAELHTMITKYVGF